MEASPDADKGGVTEMLSLPRFARTMLVILALIAPAACSLGKTNGIDADLGEKEVKYGQEAAAQIAKDSKLSDDAAKLKRVRDIGAKIAAVANKLEVSSVYGAAKVTPFEYKFNVIEDKDVNAFSVPGGNIYINTGLLDFVQSDQELAGVIAHEVTHASHHHMIYLLSKQASLNNQMAIALLATMLAGAKTADLGNVLLGVQLFQIAKLNGYGMQAERDSDRGAIYYLRASGYNPVGLLTFLERLSRRPELVDLGIYRSHPLDADRVKAARELLTSLNIPINRRATTNAIIAEVKNDKVGDADVPGVYIQEKLIYRPAPLGGRTSAQRAQAVADRINKALDDGVQMRELTVDPIVGGVVAGDEVLLVVTDNDAKLMAMTSGDVAKGAATAIRNVIWKQMVDTVQ